VRPAVVGGVVRWRWRRLNHSGEQGWRAEARWR
jgi:hypothetical protein